MKRVAYSLPILPHTTQVSGTLGSSGGEDGGGSGSGGTSEVTLASASVSDPWTELEARLRSFAPPPARISVSRGLAIVDVFASPSAHRQVEQVIKEITDIYSQTIQIDVGIYFVNVSDVDDFAIGLGLTPGDFTVIGAVGQLSSTAAGTLGFNRNGGFSQGGSSVQLRALAENTAVADSYFASTRVQPGVTVPLVNTESTNYVSGTNVTTTTTSTTTSITTAKFDAGLTIYSVAQLSANGDIIVDTTISQTALNEIKAFTSGSNTVQLPNSSQRLIKGSGVMRSGGSLILAGYEQDYNRKADKGTGTPQIKLLGGSTKGDIRRVQMIAIVRSTLVGS